MAGEIILNQMNRMFDAPNPLEMFMGGQQSAQALDAERMQNMITQNQVGQLPLMNQFDATKLQQVQQQIEAQRTQDETAQMEMRRDRLVQGAQEALALPESRRTPFLVGVANEIDPSGEFARDLLDMQAKNPAEVQATLERLSALGQQQGQAKKQFGSTRVMVDETGRYFNTTLELDPIDPTKTRSIAISADGSDSKPSGALRPVNELGETPEDIVGRKGKESSVATGARLKQELEYAPKIEERKTEASQAVKQRTEPTLQASTEAAKSAIKKSDAAMESLSNVKTSMSVIDEAIAAIDAGANTGVIDSKLPSVKAASVELDNIKGRLGLSVISGGQFGQLAVAEMQFALETALPTNLEPPELKTWLTRKKAAQQKLATQLEDAAIYLGKPGNTSAGYLEYLRNRQPQTQTVPPQTGQFKSSSGITFTVE